MGSHEPVEGGALHHGGRPGPEAVPEPPAEVPVGRRLRPEQSAATGDVLPALEDRAEPGPAESDRTGGRWRPGAPVKLAALTVAAAAAMLGGTAAGVQAWKDSAGPLFGCSAGECPTADPEGGATGPEEPVPGEEPPRPERSRTAAPSPSPAETTGRPESSRTPKARPATREPTRRPRGTGSASGGDEEARKQGLSVGRPGTPHEETPTQTAAPTPTQAPSTAPPPDSGNGEGEGDGPEIPLPLPLPLPLDGKD
ncbi:hypothetical protein [Planomonospora parontospora]|uniref:hypothetical protein n=1 Tax=Planomonospora parontospora TaxID=58119 RepID=UPI001670B455|nr:hypothetical protein [Planomonospora parontospora]GGL39317.1 hypothetical protein GCM10014719_45520 [Planomonospora parontospora subsp. antibiotica]GII18154.1 hypothetical protein Ppa05_48800 [Planomonospora parontospora subsp. antibiotica]